MYGLNHYCKLHPAGEEANGNCDPLRGMTFRHMLYPQIAVIEFEHPGNIQDRLYGAWMVVYGSESESFDKRWGIWSGWELGDIQRLRRTSTERTSTWSCSNWYHTPALASFRGRSCADGFVPSQWNPRSTSRSPHLNSIMFSMAHDYSSHRNCSTWLCPPWFWNA